MMFDTTYDIFALHNMRRRTSLVCFHLSHMISILTWFAMRSLGSNTLTANLDVLLRIDAIVKVAPV